MKKTQNNLRILDYIKTAWSDEKFFTSKQFNERVSKLCEMVTNRYKNNPRYVPIKTDLYWNSEDNSVACTDNNFIRINMDNKLVQEFDKNRRALAIWGFLAHELGHCLYTDFTIKRKFLKGDWDYSRLSVFDFYNTHKMAFLMYIKEMQNILEDPFIEYKITSVYTGSFKRGINFTTSLLQNSLKKTFDKNEYDLFTLLLAQARNCLPKELLDEYPCLIETQKVFDRLYTLPEPTMTDRCNMTLDLFNIVYDTFIKNNNDLSDEEMQEMIKQMKQNNQNSNTNNNENQNSSGISLPIPLPSDSKSDNDEKSSEQSNQKSSSKGNDSSSTNKKEEKSATEENDNKDNSSDAAAYEENNSTQNGSDDEQSEDSESGSDSSEKNNTESNDSDEKGKSNENDTSSDETDNTSDSDSNKGSSEGDCAENNNSADSDDNSAENGEASDETDNYTDSDDGKNNCDEEDNDSETNTMDDSSNSDNSIDDKSNAEDTNNSNNENSDTTQSSEENSTITDSSSENKSSDESDFSDKELERNDELNNDESEVSKAIDDSEYDNSLDFNPEDVITSVAKTLMREENSKITKDFNDYEIKMKLLQLIFTEV